MENRNQTKKEEGSRNRVRVYEGEATGAAWGAEARVYGGIVIKIARAELLLVYFPRPHHAPKYSKYENISVSSSDGENTLESCSQAGGRFAGNSGGLRKREEIERPDSRRTGKAGGPEGQGAS